jgi:hypothetical protein
VSNVVEFRWDQGPKLLSPGGGRQGLTLLGPGVVGGKVGSWLKMDQRCWILVATWSNWVLGHGGMQGPTLLGPSE